MKVICDHARTKYCTDITDLLWGRTCPYSSPQENKIKRCIWNKNIKVKCIPYQEGSK
jgi:hypothetical protein